MDLAPYRSRLRENVDVEALAALMERVDDLLGRYLVTLCLKDAQPDEISSAARPLMGIAANSPANAVYTKDHVEGLTAFFSDYPRGLRITLEEPELQLLWEKARGHRAREA